MAGISELIKTLGSQKYGLNVKAKPIVVLKPSSNPKFQFSSDGRF
jgi:hypothetical protein